VAEKVIVRMNRDYEVGFWYVNPESDRDDFQTVHGLHEVTPYGMMLISLASCTAQILLSYAQNHSVDLEDVALRLVYERVYAQDCEDCEDIEHYKEHITQEIALNGDLSDKEREKLFRIAHQCPIEKMFIEGIPIDTEMVEVELLEVEKL
jgi:putative redox protein